MGSSRRPRVDSKPTAYHLEARPFVEWFKVTYMSPLHSGSRWLHQTCAWVVPL
ncbi:hypothetical protein E2C01_021275 [Portunus trituberculatus]|uniref:Uncharacterized protein n=1 Tax=Portunus trituberculatus TaxID=210409 RepID=A0A5B7E268_PORTR|nr:hypothetical protein [Portunus trituberculatus]